ncbi:hypothetical protein [Azospirillum ramasamyi]|uniref:Uncharacterized protein n=1 Tax=Azospirillum ramasamyi TaxID=682998 RepID=A0A2U9SH02_9PROT|nr:hypothetical protein [Azospirillum ramasamyi]AWU98073.1 hypothetical protein DM194_27685 [Azospirillum ramasamyi]
MTTFHHRGTKLPKKKARSLQDWAAHIGESRSYTECQRGLAACPGHPDWTALRRDAENGTAAPSELDDALPEELVQTRRAEQAAVLNRLWRISGALARTLIGHVRPTARTSDNVPGYESRPLRVSDLPILLAMESEDEMWAYLEDRVPPLLQTRAMIDGDPDVDPEGLGVEDLDDIEIGHIQQLGDGGLQVGGTATVWHHGGDEMEVTYLIDLYPDRLALSFEDAQFSR